MIRSIKWLALLFCATFIVAFAAFMFAKRSDRAAETVPANVPPLMNKPLPEANLVDSSGAKLEDPILRSGKVVLVFVAAKCPACDDEITFLKNLVNQHSDIRFFGVVSFGVADQLPEGMEKEFPFMHCASASSAMSTVVLLASRRHNSCRLPPLMRATTP